MAGPDVQAIGLLAVGALPLELALQPFPILLLFLLGQARDIGVFTTVALEDAGRDQVEGVGHGVDQGLGVVNDQAVRADALFQP